MKINCIIQARMGSTRLPGKVLEKIGKNTLLRMVVERCKLAKNIDRVIVATHDIEWSVEANITGVEWINGPEEPAARFVKVLTEYPCDGFVRVCADSPFIDAGVIDECAAAAREGAQYYLGGTYAGNHAEGFNSDAFVFAVPCMREDEREHLGLWFQRASRLTVDTPADLERARLIVSRMDKPHTEYTAAECLDLLRK